MPVDSLIPFYRPGPNVQEDPHRPGDHKVPTVLEWGAAREQKSLSFYRLTGRVVALPPMMREEGEEMAAFRKRAEKAAHVDFLVHRYDAMQKHPIEKCRCKHCRERIARLRTLGRLPEGVE